MHLCTVGLVTIVLVFNLPTIECSGYPRYPKPNPNPNPYPNPRVVEKYVCIKQKDYFPNTCSRGYTPVSWGLICDGTKQCPCGDDEKHCTTPAPVTCPTTPPPTTQSPPISCGEVPNDVDNGLYELTSGTGVEGDDAILICNLGYCLFPESLSFVSITCLPGGNWSTPAAEVCLCLSTRNLALGQTNVIQSSDLNSANTADRAVDGIRTTFLISNFGVLCTETKSSPTDTNPFWQVTFGSNVRIGSVTITNRLNNNNAAIAARLNNIEIKAGIGTADMTCATFVGPAAPNVSQYTFDCDTVILANVLKITKDTKDNGILTLCEVEVYTFQKRCNGLYTIPNVIT